MKTNAILDTDEAAALLLMSPLTLRRWRSAGVGPKPIWTKGGIRYRAEDISAWLRMTAIGQSTSQRIAREVRK
jgi:hypothetical protein